MLRSTTRSNFLSLTMPNQDSSSICTKNLIHLLIHVPELFAGDDCETDIDGCADSPCADGQNCTDNTAIQQVALGVAFNCTPCPTGFRENTGKCIGKCLF